MMLPSLYVRTGDPLYRTLAKRWSEVMIALAAFVAVGVVALLRPQALE
jgi:cytochrome bd-type quinol oxidase subunit 1